MEAGFEEQEHANHGPCSIVWLGLDSKPAAFAKARYNQLLINKDFSFHVVS